MQRFYQAIHSATIWLGKIMGKAMTRMGLD